MMVTNGETVFNWIEMSLCLKDRCNRHFQLLKWRVCCPCASEECAFFYCLLVNRAQVQQQERDSCFLFTVCFCVILSVLVAAAIHKCPQQSFTLMGGHPQQSIFEMPPWQFRGQTDGRQFYPPNQPTPAASTALFKTEVSKHSFSTKSSTKPQS